MEEAGRGEILTRASAAPRGALMLKTSLVFLNFRAGGGPFISCTDRPLGAG